MLVHEMRHSMDTWSNQMLRGENNERFIGNEDKVGDYNCKASS